MPPNRRAVEPERIEERAQPGHQFVDGAWHLRRPREAEVAERVRRVHSPRRAQVGRVRRPHRRRHVEAVQEHERRRVRLTPDLHARRLRRRRAHVARLWRRGPQPQHRLYAAANAVSLADSHGHSHNSLRARSRLPPCEVRYGPADALVVPGRDCRRRLLELANDERRRRSAGGYRCAIRATAELSNVPPVGGAGSSRAAMSPCQVPRRFPRTSRPIAPPVSVAGPTSRSFARSASASTPQNAELCPTMPRFDAIGDVEADAIVAYLRSLPAVTHAVAPSMCPPVKPPPGPDMAMPRTCRAFA